MGSLNTRLWDRATAGYGISQHPAMGPRHTGERGFSAPENGKSPYYREKDDCHTHTKDEIITS